MLFWTPKDGWCKRWNHVRLHHHHHHHHQHQHQHQQQQQQQGQGQAQGQQQPQPQQQKAATTTTRTTTTTTTRAAGQQRQDTTNCTMKMSWHFWIKWFWNGIGGWNISNPRQFLEVLHFLLELSTGSFDEIDTVLRVHIRDALRTCQHQVPWRELSLGLSAYVLWWACISSRDG